MKGAEKEAEFRSADGTALRGTLLSVPSPRLGALLVHGITADRQEDGFYARLAESLAGAGASSLRFDFRAHGKSGGRYEDLTLSGVINDIGSAYGALSDSLPAGAPKVVVAASFGGGLSACWAADSGRPPDGLVLLNPLLDYGKRMLFDKPFWEDGALTERGRAELDGRGWLPHGEFRIGRSLFNELFRIRPHERIKSLGVPLLAVHGSSDSVVPYGIAKSCVSECPGAEFVTVEGADHGFTHPGDDCLEHPETERFRKGVIEKVVEWAGKRAR